MKRKSNCLATILFLIYLALLVWIILFKLQFSISDLDKVRSINLIPFHYDKEVGAAFHLTEVLENFLIFAYDDCFSGIEFTIFTCNSET